MDYMDQQSIFTLCMALSCKAVPTSTPSIEAEKAIDFLLLEKSNTWTWNYWRNGSLRRKSESLPDDLDDTFCALSALTIHNQSIITPHVLAQVTHTLISCEAAVGGPYYTWIHDHSDTKWNNIDVAVNANIAYFLTLNHITPPQGLISYIDDMIECENFTSEYYVSKSLILYFIARSYSGTIKDTLIEILRNEYEKSGTETDRFLCALALTHLGIEVDYQPTSLLEPIPLYTENIRGSDRTEVTSQSITPFLLSEYEYLRKKLEKDSLRLSIYTQSQQILEKTLGESEIISEKLRRIRSFDNHDRISLMPFRIAESLSNTHTISLGDIEQVGVATVLGWVAYDIFDSIYDEGSYLSDLPIAIASFRHSISIFLSLLPIEYSSLIEAYMAPMEQSFYKASHPADKSWGHVLGAIVVLVLAGEDPRGESVHLLSEYFKNILAARQLLDDMHDMDEDALKNNRTLPVTLQEEGLTYPEITELIKNEIRMHVHNSRAYLDRISILKERTYFEAMISQIERSISDHEKRFSEAFYIDYAKIPS